MALLPEGWIKGSGSSSAKAGMNGGMDFLCGRLVYYDEITNDYGSSDSERIEYLKSITMEQRVLNTRTVKTAGEGGLETFTTVVLDSLHYESHLMCTNCGPLGLRADVEPSTNRIALTDRSIAHIVVAVEDDESADIDFDLQTASDDIKAQVNKFRVCSCIVAYILIYIKHIPSCRPNLVYANMLCNKWYLMMWEEYNIPRPSKRKKIKLRMMLELFAVESAVFEKFMMPESGVDFADMQPDENGNLPPFCIEQLADVVRSLQRCLDLEVIHNAWSHSLDHSPATCAHVFQMNTVLSQLHGCELDRSTLSGVPPTPPGQAPPPPPRAPYGRQKETTLEDMENDKEREDGDDPEVDVFNQTFQYQPPQNTGPSGPSGAPGPSGARKSPQGDEAGQSVPLGHRDADLPPLASGAAPRERMQLPTDRVDPPRDTNGNPTITTVVVKGMMHGGMSRQSTMQLSEEMGIQRELRCEMSNRLTTKKMSNTVEVRGESVAGNTHQRLTNLFQDGSDKNKEPMHKMSSGRVISAKRAAGACMPSASDVLGRGMSSEFVKDIVEGNESKGFDTNGQFIGTKSTSWEYETFKNDSAVKGPADYNFNWARLTAFTKNRAAGADAATAPSGGASKQKSVWSNSARVIKQATARGDSKAFSLMMKESVSVECMRDTLFMIGQNQTDNKKRIPRQNYTSREVLNEKSCMLSGNETFKETTGAKTIHPHGMFSGNPKKTVLGTFELDPQFAFPTEIERPIGSTVATSDYQKRLDHLTNTRALPACITPDAFEKGVPIKESESCNGIYFNKHTASEHSALVVEMGLYLSNIPGIVGGKYTAVPDTFKWRKEKGERGPNQVDAEMEESRNSAVVDRRDTDNAMEEGGSGGSVSSHSVVVEQDDMERMGEDAEEDADEDFAETDSPNPDVGDESHTLQQLEASVDHPGSVDPNILPMAGASNAAAALGADQAAMQDSLPFEWDQFGMFFSCKFAETLHNDCHAYVDKVRAKFTDVYEDETRDTTLAGLPQIALRFPGVAEKNKALFPLSRSIPLVESRVCDVTKHMTSSRASKAITEAVSSFAHGRAIGYNDPEILEKEAEARGMDTAFNLTGNLFARSTWQRFTLSALDARGMLTPEEVIRVNDQGLCMRLRVRNHRGSVGHEDCNKNLEGNTLAVPHSFEAQERKKRMLAENENAGTTFQSLNSKRRAMQYELDSEMIVDDVNEEASV